MTQGGQPGPSRKNQGKNRCLHRCNMHDIDIENDCHDDNSVDGLVDQVQSLFYAWENS